LEHRACQYCFPGRSVARHAARLAVVWLIALATCLAVGPAVVEATPTTDLPEANADDGPRYPVMGVEFFYTRPNLPLPAMSE